MALPLPSSLACSRLKPEGIRGFGTPPPSDPDMENGECSGCFVVFKVLCGWVFTSESLRILLCLGKNEKRGLE